MTRNTKLAIGITALIGIPGIALAVDAVRPGPPTTRAEVTTRVQARFAKLDANKDGKLSAEEIGAARDDRRANRFAMVDTDHNGALSPAEFAAGPERGPGRRGGHLGRGGMLMKADANGDGVVTLAEVQAPALARFDRVDANHDGTLSADERAAARRERWQGRGGR